jgi:hypothetical protein
MVTSTDVVLLVTKNLRKYNLTGDIFVEFFGPGVRLLSVADRSAIANMCSEYGSLIGYFPLDELTMEYLSHTGRDKQQLKCIEAYMKRVGLFRTYSKVRFFNFRKLQNDLKNINFFQCMLIIYHSSVVGMLSGGELLGIRLLNNHLLNTFGSKSTARHKIYQLLESS